MPVALGGAGLCVCTQLFTLVLPRKGKPGRSWVAAFKKKWGWSAQKLNSAGGAVYYDIDHPKMKKQRVKFRESVNMHKVDLRLTLNYDQVWKLRQRPRTAKVFKSREAIGTTNVSRAKLGTGRSARTKLLQRVSGKPPQPNVTNGEVPVDAQAKFWRHAHTVVTSVWLARHLVHMCEHSTSTTMVCV